MEKTIWTLGIFALGLFFIYMGIMVRIGKWRRQLMFRGFPVLASPVFFLIAIPLGLSLVIIGLKIIFPEWDLLIPLAICFFSAMILSFWMPDWLFPKWFRWLMNKYEHVLGEMFEEAHQMGVKEWEAQTSTQEDLEQWADSIARKHGWRRSNRLNPQRREQR